MRVQRLVEPVERRLDRYVDVVIEADAEDGEISAHGHRKNVGLLG